MISHINACGTNALCSSVSASDTAMSDCMEHRYQLVVFFTYIFAGFEAFRFRMIQRKEKSIKYRLVCVCMWLAER